MPTPAPERLAAQIHDLERRLKAVERGSQASRTSLEVDGQQVTLPTVVRTGIQAQETAVAASVAASEAEAAAQAAYESALAASESATVALETADGKNSVTYAVTDPDTDGTAPGDLWFRRNSSGVITGTWEWTGAAPWEPRTFGDGVLASLTVGKLVSGSIAVGQKIIAGPETGTHVEISDTGFRTFAPNPTAGQPPLEATRMGTASDDYIAVVGADGRIKASFDLTGKVTASSGNIDGDVVLNGRPLSQHLASQAEGLKYLGEGVTTARSTGAEIGLFDIAVTLYPGRSYTLNTSHMRYHSNLDGYMLGQVAVHYTVATAPAIPVAPTTASPMMTRSFVCSPYGFSQGMAPLRKLMRMPNDGVVRNYRFLFSHQRISGSGDMYVESSGGADDVMLWVEDVGPTVQSSLTPNDGGGSGAVTPVQRYEIQFDSSWSRTWQGSGAVFSDSAAWQGSIGDANGNMFSAIGWGDLTYYLSGSSIESIQVYLYSEHWYYNSGGVAHIGLHGHLTPPSGLTLAQFGNVGDVGGFPRGGGQWVSIGSTAFDGWKTGAFRGVLLGPSPNAADRTYYGRFSGGAASKIKIVYYK